MAVAPSRRARPASRVLLTVLGGGLSERCVMIEDTAPCLACAPDGPGR